MSGNLKEDVVKHFVREAGKLGFIESLTLVGSHGEVKRSLERVNDLDFLIVADSLTWEKYRKLQKVFRRVRDAYETEEVGMHYEEKIGPIKMKVNKTVNIILHQLLFDVASYRRYAERCPLAAYDWQRFQPLVGKNISEISEVSGITGSCVLSARGGIEDYINQILNRKIACLVYRKGDELPALSVQRVGIDRQQEIELLYNAMRNAIRNFMKLHKGGNVDFNSTTEEFFGINREHRGLFYEVERIKTRLRNDRHAKADIKKLKSKTVEFLEHVRSMIQNQ